MELHGFQRQLLADYFDGVRETLVLMPKKGGKSTLLAAVALHRLASVATTSVAIVASSRDQAMILFEQARGFVQRTEWLRDGLRVLRGYREIRRKGDGQSDMEFTGLIKVYAADADTADGWLGDLALVDELHRHKSADLYGVLRDGLGPRNGQLITISTAGDSDDSPLGLLRAKAYELEGLVRDGAYRHVRSPGFAMHEWALDHNDDLTDIDLVKTANPAPWQTLDELRGRHESPSMSRHQWARFACGVWGQGAEPGFDHEAWAALNVVELPEPGRSIVIGFDGARRRDDTGLVGCDIETGALFVIGHWHKPADDDEWECPEDEVNQVLADAMERWEVWRMYADPPYWESAVDRWAGEYGQDRVVRWWTNRIKQTAMAVRNFRNDMRPGEMSHDGDDTLGLHVRNAVRQETRMVENDEALFLIRKPGRESPHKIDLAMCALLAWEARGDAIAAGGPDQPSSFVVVV